MARQTLMLMMPWGAHFRKHSGTVGGMGSELQFCIPPDMAEYAQSNRPESHLCCSSYGLLAIHVFIHVANCSDAVKGLSKKLHDCTKNTCGEQHQDKPPPARERNIARPLTSPGSAHIRPVDLVLGEVGEAREPGLIRLRRGSGERAYESASLRCYLRVVEKRKVSNTPSSIGTQLVYALHADVLCLVRSSELPRLRKLSLATSCSI